MKPGSSLTLTQEAHDGLRQHLFPGDGLEAAAILICSRAPGARRRLLVQDVVLVPHAACVRESDRLVWPGIAIEEAIDRTEVGDKSLVLLHSHPGGLFGFSRADDLSDQVTIPALHQALRGDHGSAVMLRDGAMLVRLYGPEMRPSLIDMIMVPGHDIKMYWSDGAYRRRPTAFTSQMTDELSRLVVCVLGVSGTGSIVAEQLARLGVGRVILIDFDRVELRNLNRILNSTLEDVEKKVFKVVAMARAISLYRGADVAVPLAASITEREAVVMAAQADALFSCVDTLEARRLADLIAASFMIAMFDVGVTIPTRRAGDSFAIADVCGRIDYVRPGGSTLQDRGVYDPAALRAEYLRRVNPEAHADEVQRGYIKGLAEEAPSVISLNMRASAAVVMELITRLYPFRHATNELFSRTEFSLAAAEEEYIAESCFVCGANPQLGIGESEPLLGLPALASPRGQKK